MPKTTIVMKNFIEDYFQNPAQAIVNARQTADAESWYDNIDEDMIYAQIASGEFKLYEAMIFAPDTEELPARARVSA